MRDEAHRFAITFQQKLMRRRNFRSVLEDIPGVGEGRKKLLLRHFGSLKRVREGSIEELAEVVGPSVAERIHAALHGDEQEAEAQDEVREASLQDAGSEAHAGDESPPAAVQGAPQAQAENSEEKRSEGSPAGGQ
jgi:excinuclease ABC subunit C